MELTFEAFISVFHTQLAKGNKHHTLLLLFYHPKQSVNLFPGPEQFPIHFLVFMEQIRLPPSC